MTFYRVVSEVYPTLRKCQGEDVISPAGKGTEELVQRPSSGEGLVGSEKSKVGGAESGWERKGVGGEVWQLGCRWGSPWGARASLQREMEAMGVF